MCKELEKSMKIKSNQVENINKEIKIIFKRTNRNSGVGKY